MFIVTAARCSLHGLNPQDSRTQRIQDNDLYDLSVHAACGFQDTIFEVAVLISLELLTSGPVEELLARSLLAKEVSCRGHDGRGTLRTACCLSFLCELENAATFVSFCKDDCVGVEQQGNFVFVFTRAIHLN